MNDRSKVMYVTCLLLLCVIILNGRAVYWKNTIRPNGRLLIGTKISAADFAAEIARVEAIALETEFDQELMPDPRKLAYDLRMLQQRFDTMLKWIRKRDAAFSV